MTKVKSPPQEEKRDDVVLAPKNFAALKAQAIVTSMGFPPTPRPTPEQMETELPEDLAEADTHLLGYHLSVWTAKRNYGNTMKAHVFNDLEIEEERFKFLLQDGLNRIGTVGTLTDKRNHVATNPKVMEQQGKVNETRYVYNLLSTLCDNYERNYQAVSREIARRGMPSDG